MLLKIFADRKRFLSSLVIVLVMVAVFVITRYNGEPGRIVGLIVYGAIGMFGLSEVAKALGCSKYAAAFVSLSVIPFLLNEFSPFVGYLTEGPNWDDGTLHRMLLLSLRDWKPYLIIIIVSFVPLLVENNFRRLPNVFGRQVMLIFVVVLTSLFAKSIWVINMESLWKVLFFTAIAFLTDTMAYVGGMLFGQKWFGGALFAPRISPKKTWAGFTIAVVSGLIFAILVGYFGNIWSEFDATGQIVVSVVGGLILTVVAPYGDLTFSAIKRYVGIKDYSDIIPGHGGVYDRVDSLSAVMVVGSIIYLFVR